jgi:YHS domain-containing protein
MMELLVRLLEFVAIVWIVRFLFSNLIGGSSNTQRSSQTYGAASNQHSSEPASMGEMKKDPQCGTYVSTELSLKARYGGEVLHFCSQECQDAYLQARSTKPA